MARLLAAGVLLSIAAAPAFACEGRSQLRPIRRSALPHHSQPITIRLHCRAQQWAGVRLRQRSTAWWMRLAKGQTESARSKPVIGTWHPLRRSAAKRGFRDQIHVVPRENRGDPRGRLRRLRRATIAQSPEMHQTVATVCRREWSILHEPAPANAK